MLSTGSDAKSLSRISRVQRSTSGITRELIEWPHGFEEFVKNPSKQTQRTVLPPRRIIIRQKNDEPALTHLIPVKQRTKPETEVRQSTEIKSQSSL